MMHIKGVKRERIQLSVAEFYHLTLLESVNIFQFPQRAKKPLHTTKHSVNDSSPLCIAFSVLNRPTQMVARKRFQCKLKIAVFP